MGRLAFFETQQAQHAADAAAEALAAAMADNVVTRAEVQAIVDAHRRWFTNHDFAARLVEEVGPEGVIQLPMMMSVAIEWAVLYDDADHHELTGHRIDNERLLACLGIGIAAVTDPAGAHSLGSHWRQRLLDETADIHSFDNLSNTKIAHIPGSWSLGILLRHGAYSASFLDDVGDALMVYDRQPGAWPYELDNADWTIPYDPGVNHRHHEDPFVGYLVALSRNPDAARHFFLEDATVAGETTTRLDYLLTERPWADDVNHLGDALEAATLHDIDGTDAAEIAARTVHYIATGDPPTLPPASYAGIGRILAAYTADVQLALSGRVDMDAGWVTTTPNRFLPPDVQPEVHAGFQAGDLQNALRVILVDGEAYRAIADAHVAYMRSAIELASAQHVDSPFETRVTAVVHAAEGWANPLGQIVEIHEQALRDFAVSEAAELIPAGSGHDRLVQLAQAGVGFIPHPGIRVAAVAVVQGFDIVFDHVAGANAEAALETGQDIIDHARAAAAREEDDALTLVRQMVTGTLLHDPDIAAQATSWITDPGNDVPPDGWFLDTTGHVLPREELAGTEAGRWALTWMNGIELEPGEKLGDRLGDVETAFQTGQTAGRDD